MHAASRESEDTVELLLKAGANPTREFESRPKFLPGLHNDMPERIVAARKEWREKKREK